MDFLRSHTIVRYGVMAALIAAAAYIAPSVADADRSIAGFGLFEHVPFILSLVLAYAALRVGDASVRAKLAIGVIAAFALTAAFSLSFSVPSLAFVGLSLAVGYLEWPAEVRKVWAY